MYTSLQATATDIRRYVSALMSISRAEMLLGGLTRVCRRDELCPRAAIVLVVGLRSMVGVALVTVAVVLDAAMVELVVIEDQRTDFTPSNMVGTESKKSANFSPK